MDLCRAEIPIRYRQLRARLQPLVWKEWFSSRSLSSGEGNCHENRMHGTRPSFYGNKRNLKEELGGVREDDKEETNRDVFWNRWWWKAWRLWNASNLGLPCGSQCYSFISWPHSSSLWLHSFPNNILNYLQSRRGAKPLSLPVLNHMFCTAVYRSAVLCCVKRQGLKSLHSCLLMWSLCTTSAHKHMTKPMFLPSLQPACKQHFLKHTKKRKPGE